ncbi:MAG TPA: cytochrome P450 [Rhizobacter sp.]
MSPLPRDPLLDSTLALFANPYGFIAERCRRLRSDLFEARILLRPTVCMSGQAAARLFYDEGVIERHGAAPEPLRATLFGKGGVQGLDGAAHRHRKALFLQILAPEAVAVLAARTQRLWEHAAAQWQPGQQIVLYETAQALLTQAVCDWAGVPLDPSQAPSRTSALAALYDSAARGPVLHLRARLARRQAERWMAGLVEATRRGELHPRPHQALHRIAWHRDLDGELMSPKVAATELLNVLRPTVAVSVYIVWTVLALTEHPRCRLRLEDGDERYLLCFLQEVRRHYPFFPAVAGRVKRDVEWHGVLLRKGQRALLDLHGTNHDPRSWESPGEFLPERFLGVPPSPYAFVPQGGATVERHHRCPGEGLAVALMGAAARALLPVLPITLPMQNLEIDTRRLPALPRSHLVIERRAAPAHAGT